MRQQFWRPDAFRAELARLTRNPADALQDLPRDLLAALDAKSPERSEAAVAAYLDRNKAELIGARSLRPCAPDVAERHSGYKVGGTSPFGLKRAMPIYMERTIAELERIYINGGARGFLVEIDPRDLVRVLSPVAVDAAQPVTGTT